VLDGAGAEDVDLAGEEGGEGGVHVLIDVDLVALQVGERLAGLVLIPLAEVGVPLKDHPLARAVGLDHEGTPGNDLLGVLVEAPHALDALGALFLVDRAEDVGRPGGEAGDGEGLGVGLGVDELQGVVVDLLDGDRLVADEEGVAAVGADVRVHVDPVGHDPVVGGDRLAVRPLHALPDLEGDLGLVLADLPGGGHVGNPLAGGGVANHQTGVVHRHQVGDAVGLGGDEGVHGAEVADGVIHQRAAGLRLPGLRGGPLGRPDEGLGQRPRGQQNRHRNNEPNRFPHRSLLLKTSQAAASGSALALGQRYRAPSLAVNFLQLPGTDQEG